MAAMQGVRCFLLSQHDTLFLRSDECVSFMPAASCSGRVMASKEVSNGGRMQRTRASVMSSLPDGSTSLVAHKPAEVEEPYYWPQQLPPALQRLMLESQWTQSLDRHMPNVDAYPSREIIATTQNVVTSGRPSARQRRLNARLTSPAAAASKEIEDSAASLPVNWRRQKQNRVKAEPVQDFLTSYLKHVSKVDLLTKEEELHLSKQLRMGQKLVRLRKQLKKELGHEPSYELWAESAQMSTRELLTKIAQGEKARERMTMANIRLVVAVAKNYQNQGVDLADLIQEGSRGLIRGLMKYDHTKGFKVSTYVHWWIRQGVTRAIAEHSRVVRLPVHMHEKLFRIKRLNSQLKRQRKTISVQETSEVLKISRENVEIALKANQRVLSFDKKRRIGSSFEESDSTMHDILPDRNPQNEPWTSIERDELREDLTFHISSLTQMEKDILLWHHGLGTLGGYCWTLQSIGDRFGLSKERVRQIKQRAIQKMQEEIRISNS